MKTGFTATFMLHGADCPLDFAWYNETGSPPAASDLHVVIPAGAWPERPLAAGDEVEIVRPFGGG